MVLFNIVVITYAAYCLGCAMWYFIKFASFFANNLFYFVDAASSLDPKEAGRRFWRLVYAPLIVIEGRSIERIDQ